jgi:hypothetical protein
MTVLRSSLRIVALALVAALVAACSSSPSTATPAASTAAPPPLPTPSAVPATTSTPAAEPELLIVEEATAVPLPPELTEPITSLLPEIRIELTEPAAADLLPAVMGVDGVTFATAISEGTITFGLPDGRSGRMTVAGIDPVGFRHLAPQISADDPGLWSRLLEGHAAATHGAAEALALELRAVLTAPTGPLALGAIAANGQPPVADLLVDQRTAAQLGLPEPHVVLVSVRPEAWPDEVAADIAALVDVEPTLIYGKPQRTVEGLPDDTIWDALAMCESSGRWDIDTGNGYYGGLQFLPSSWHLVGGTGLPHEASREEQIYRAELLLARQGWKAWPACSLRLGLREPDPDE